jgi:ankyrin repeat protein
VDGNQILELDAAFRAGDLEAVRTRVPEPDAFPNGPMPMSIGPCLEYAIYHSPVDFVRRLLELGAETSPEQHDGFPPIIAAVANGPEGRTEEIVQLLLEHGADPNQQGFNDYSALHFAVEQRRPRLIRILLEAGADPDLPTRIDDLESPRDIAERMGDATMLALLPPPEGKKSGTEGV